MTLPRFVSFRSAACDPSFLLVSVTTDFALKARPGEGQHRLHRVGSHRHTAWRKMKLLQILRQEVAPLLVHQNLSRT